MQKALTLAFITLLVLAATSCHRSGTNSSTPGEETTAASPRPASSPLSDFEETLKYVRNGQFTYIYVFLRKDGKPLDSEDGDFLRTNAPQLVDRAATKDKKKLICGTNFNLEEGNLNLIKKRLVVEDYSGR